MIPIAAVAHSALIPSDEEFFPKGRHGQIKNKRAYASRNLTIPSCKSLLKQPLYLVVAHFFLTLELRVSRFLEYLEMHIDVGHVRALLGFFLLGFWL